MTCGASTLRAGSIEQGGVYKVPISQAGSGQSSEGAKWLDMTVDLKNGLTLVEQKSVWVRDFRKWVKRDTDMGMLEICLGDKILHCDHRSL